MQLKGFDFNMHAPVVKNRWIIVVVAVLSAIAFALSVQAGMWWTVGETHVGPYGTSRCFGGDCANTGLAWLGGSPLWMRTAIATWAAGWIAMIALLIVAAGLAAKRVPKLAARGALVAVLTAIATGAYFFFAFPGLPGMSVDRGVLFYAAGIVLGLGATIRVLTA